MIISRSSSCPKCGDDHGNSCYIVYHDGWKCFACGASNRKSSDSFAFRELQALPERNLFVPEHTTNIRQFSLQTLSWLYSFYLTDSLIRQYKIAFCAEQGGKPESLLLPITFDGAGNVVEYQRRFFPKAFYSSAGVKKTTFITGEYNNNTVVIVEDFISAVRVGQFNTTLCLFGTSLTQLNKDWLCTHASKIILWLDNDEPGIQASNKIKGELITHYNKLFKKFPLLHEDTEILQVFSDKSPKELNDNKIKTTMSAYI